MAPSVLITGVTGYVGGTVFNRLLTAHKGEYSVTAYIRDENTAKAVEALGATPLIGSYDTLDILTKAAKEHDVFFMEALWTRFHPLTKEVKRIAEEGPLGDPLVMHADLSGFFDIESRYSFSGVVF